MCKWHGMLEHDFRLLTCLAVLPPRSNCARQVIGGGLPVGAYGGKKEIMQMVAPAGPMYQVRWVASVPAYPSARALHAGVGDLALQGAEAAWVLLLLTTWLAGVGVGVLTACTPSHLHLTCAGGHPVWQPPGHGGGHQDPGDPGPRG